MKKLIENLHKLHSEIVESVEQERENIIREVNERFDSQKKELIRNLFVALFEASNSPVKIGHSFKRGDYILYVEQLDFENFPFIDPESGAVNFFFEVEVSHRNQKDASMRIMHTRALLQLEKF